MPDDLPIRDELRIIREMLRVSLNLLHLARVRQEASDTKIESLTEELRRYTAMAARS